MASQTSFKFFLGSGVSGANLNMIAYGYDADSHYVPNSITPIVLAGVPQGTTAHPATMTLPDSIGNGRIVVYSQDQVGTLPALQTVIGTQDSGKVAIPSPAQQYNYRYDAIETALNGPTKGTSDVLDLTNIVQFGSPISVSITYKDGTTQTRGYNVSGNELVSQMTALLPKTWSETQQQEILQQWQSGSALNQPRETMMLSSNLSPNPLNIPADWDTYIEGFSKGAPNAHIASVFNGGTNGASSSLSYFTLKVDDHNLVLSPKVFEVYGWIGPASGGRVGFWHKVAMTPNTIKIPLTSKNDQADTTALNAKITEYNASQHPSKPVYTLAKGNSEGVGGSALDAVITAQIGSLVVFNSRDQPARNTTANPNASTTFTPNNAYGDVTKYLVSGFDAGYWGGTAKSILAANDPTLSSSTVDLNQSWNWIGQYAYQAALKNTPADFGYSNSIEKAAGSPKSALFFDKIAAVWFANTNTYGYSYTDFLSSRGGGANPTIPLFDKTLKDNVQDVSVTIFDMNSSPGGYTASPALYMKPEGGPMSQTMQFISGTRGHVLNIDASVAVGVGQSQGNAIVGPSDGTSILFRWYDPTDTSQQSHEKPGFVTIHLPTDGKHYGANALPNMPQYAQYFYVTKIGDTWQLTNGVATNTPGNFQLWDVPVVANGQPTLYQVVIGAGTSYEKTFNIYGKATGGFNAEFADTAIVDGGASASVISSGTVLNADEIKVTINNGGVNFDPELLKWVGDAPTSTELGASTPPLKAAIAVGSNVNGDFTPIAGTITHGDIAFGSQAGSTVAGGNFAKVFITDTKASDHPRVLTPLVGESDLGGEWVTPMSSQFGNGTYSAYMQQYSSFTSDWADTAPIGSQTTPLNFTVALAPLTLSTGASTDYLQVGASTPSSAGSWVKLSGIGSTLSNGTLVAFATDAAGNMLTRDTHTVITATDPSTKLDLAALGRIGSVTADDKSIVFFTGDQSIYLPEGDRLKFAIIAGDGKIDATPDIKVTSGSGGTFSVTVSDAALGSFTLNAEVKNNLDASAYLAASQRESDRSWVYLHGTDTVKVDLAWSGSYVNSLNFVRMDVDPSNANKIQVGGVNYGASGFTEAVTANMVHLSTQGNSTGTGSVTFTPGRDGYYAPVLVSGKGDVWMINETASSIANIDGKTHIRNFGANTFGFEDMNAAAGADFDYNDTVMHISIL